MFFQYHVLFPSHPTMGWTEKVAMNKVIGQIRIGQIVMTQVLQPANVIEGMIAYPMTSFYHHLVFFRMLPDIVSHHEEGGLDLVFVQ
jgi:hypothetical protein